MTSQMNTDSKAATRRAIRNTLAQLVEEHEMDEAAMVALITEELSSLHPLAIIVACPECGTIHEDKAEPENGWDNPPHRSHQCHACGVRWRPGDFYTNGVSKINTRGIGDTWIAASLSENRVVAPFNDFYWNKKAPWTQTFWRQQQVAKCPLDLWVYQEILFETQPNLLIETGSCLGGSAFFFATIFDLIGNGLVLTIDKDTYPERPHHDRIVYLTGDSTDPKIAEIAADYVTDYGSHAMVALDSLHTYEHVRRELELYGPMVSPGCYLVVEDTNVDVSWGKPAARQAALEFVMANPGFMIDKTREKHLLTFNPDGWIRRNY